MTKQFSRYVCVLPVKDLKESIRFYENQLGFSCSFTFGDPEYYAGLQRDDVHIHITESKPPLKNTAPVLFFVHNVNKLYEEFAAKDINIVAEIGDREYGQRDFDILDNSGNRLILSTAIEMLENQ